MTYRRVNGKEAWRIIQAGGEVSDRDHCPHSWFAVGGQLKVRGHAGVSSSTLAAEHFPRDEWFVVLKDPTQPVDLPKALEITVYVEADGTKLEATVPAEDAGKTLAYLRQILAEGV